MADTFPNIGGKAIVSAKGTIYFNGFEQKILILANIGGQSHLLTPLLAPFIPPSSRPPCDWRTITSSHPPSSFVLTCENKRSIVDFTPLTAFLSLLAVCTFKFISLTTTVRVGQIMPVFQPGLNGLEPTYL